MYRRVPVGAERIGLNMASGVVVASTTYRDNKSKITIIYCCGINYTILLILTLKWWFADTGGLVEGSVCVGGWGPKE